MKSKLAIIDISSFIFRAFYAIRPLHSPDGVPVNAVHGVLSMLLKLFEEYRPTHILVARDTKSPCFRHDIYPDYKANRTEPPEELIPQFGLIKTLLDKMQLPHLSLERYEADDIIGSVCDQWEKAFDEVFIASNDKDLMQFVNKKIKILDTMKGKFYGRDEVFEKMGVWPEQIVDYLSMLGDSSDNIPGMKGIGAKGAAQLLSSNKTLKGCIKNAGLLTNKRMKNAFDEYIDDGLLSKKLIEIPRDLPLDYKPEQTEFKFYPTSELISFLKELGFKALLKKVEDIKYVKDNEDGKPQVNIEESESTSENFHLITNKEFESFLKKLKKHDAFAIQAGFSQEEYLQTTPSITISFDGKEAFYLADLNKKNWQKLLTSTVGNPSIKIIGSELKKLFAHLYFNDCQVLCQYDDNFVANYVSGSTNRSDISTLAAYFLDYHTVYQTEDSSMQADCEKTVLNFKIEKPLKKELRERKVFKVYQDIEHPLIPILAKIEAYGVRINSKYLLSLEKRYDSIISEIQNEIVSHCEEEINLNSPKQVAFLLFEKLKLPIIKRTKTGPSTDIEVLHELDSRDLSPIPKLIIQNRELEKLLSTYIRVLPKLVHPQDKRLHTHFKQIVTTTGRLSSDKPNLQNIPVRTSYGKNIRKAFIANPGHLLLSADYSQVELRLLAHMSGDPIMIKAFKEDRDIHTQTASEIMGIPIEDITSEERSRAKAINFGLMYGQSSFGLAKNLRISRQEAKEYITGYFERFSKVKSYLDELKEKCAKAGYSITLYGRKRFLADIHSQNRTIRSNAERMAINSPIQGTAADIIKLAMMAIQQEMQKKNMSSKMILQVHDELIFEVLEEELEAMKKLVPKHMESVIKLKIPLKVDLGVGVNWFDLK